MNASEPHNQTVKRGESNHKARLDETPANRAENNEAGTDQQHSRSAQLSHSRKLLVVIGVTVVCGWLAQPCFFRYPVVYGDKVYERLVGYRQIRDYVAAGVERGKKANPPLGSRAWNELQLVQGELDRIDGAWMLAGVKSYALGFGLAFAVVQLIGRIGRKC